MIYKGQTVTITVDGTRVAMEVKGFDAHVVVLGPVGNGKCVVVKRERFEADVAKHAPA